MRNLSFLKSLINKNALNSVVTARFYSDLDESVQDGEEQKPERKFFKKPEIIDGFQVFDVYMNKKIEANTKRVFKTYEKNEKDNYARHNRMSIDQDWTNAWPTSSTFKQNAVPLPIRQGVVQSNCENAGLPPTKYGNAELMKIPNFLHLTPPHIHKHCQAIMKFCTPWPKELELNDNQLNHFPLKTTTSTYIYDGPSIRDDRARVVTLEVNIRDLKLSERSRKKFIKLCEHRYNEKSHILTLVADRCPYRRQNEEYANYLLTTLYYEAKNFESWEEEATEEDVYEWSQSKSKQNLFKVLDGGSAPDSEEEYSYRINELRNEGKGTLEAYKRTVMKVLGMKKSGEHATENR